MKNKKAHQGKPFFIKGGNNIGILLLHGWTSPPDEMQPLAKYLNSFGYTVSAPLLSGHGTKPEDLKGVTRKDWLEDSKKALEELKQHASQIFVGGISIGGDLAILISNDKSVLGILALAAPIKFPFHGLAKAGLHVMGLTKEYRKKYFPPWVRKSRGDRPAYLYYPVESAKEAVRLARETEKYLPKVAKPILIMQSTTDHMVSRKSPKIIFNKVKSKEKEILWLENAYHVFVNNKEVWGKIKDFIEKIRNPNIEIRN